MHRWQAVIKHYVCVFLNTAKPQQPDLDSFHLVQLEQRGAISHIGESKWQREGAVKSFDNLNAPKIWNLISVNSVIPRPYTLASMRLLSVKEVKGFKYVEESNRFWVLLLRFSASFPVGGEACIAPGSFFQYEITVSLCILLLSVRHQRGFQLVSSCLTLLMHFSVRQKSNKFRLRAVTTQVCHYAVISINKLEKRNLMVTNEETIWRGLVAGEGWSTGFRGWLTHLTSIV